MKSSCNQLLTSKSTKLVFPQLRRLQLIMHIEHITKSRSGWELTNKYFNRSKAMENDYMDQYFSNDAPKIVPEASKNDTEGQVFKNNTSLPKVAPCGSSIMSLFTFSQADAETGAYCLLSTIIIIQFIILTMMGYCILKRCPCCDNRRDKQPPKSNASITSPLISTTKSEILSVNYQSSDTTERVKYYNSVHTDKAVKTKDVKACMSDDILAKCLNRRDWIRRTRTPTQSREIRNDYDVIKDALTHDNERVITEKLPRETNKKESVYEPRRPIMDTPNIEMVHQVSYTSTVHPEHSSIGAACKKKSRVKSTKNSSSNPCLQKECWNDSEKEIKCLNYQNRDVYLDTSLRNVESDSVRVVKSTRSIEKGIQAFFPNDSLDDILLNDIPYLEADAISNLSFSSSLENRNCTPSDVSDNTPKNRVVKILSPSHSRSRLDGECSEPSKKAKGEIEILHLSRTSVDSSSAGSEAECLRTFKTVQSRSYL
ncbi:hypothetical protein EVAR_57578_1 [Eumeta japonica]|uniref:Uncharacterized protein n=1 Tax=Eumeta variegata TaxID=151549 RepID=A0A4C1Z3X7_EUMVA|nr:hypothetical protein EVAR_57578_1 [Eumeta japonica]